MQILTKTQQQVHNFCIQIHTKEPCVPHISKFMLKSAQTLSTLSILSHVENIWKMQVWCEHSLRTQSKTTRVFQNGTCKQYWLQFKKKQLFYMDWIKTPSIIIISLTTQNQFYVKLSLHFISLSVSLWLLPTIAFIQIKIKCMLHFETKLQF